MGGQKRPLCATNQRFNVSKGERSSSGFSCIVMLLKYSNCKARIGPSWAGEVGRGRVGAIGGIC